MTDPAPPRLRIRRLTRAFGGLTAVAGVSFDVDPGDCVGLIGPNGAGKTTLFDLISGHGRPDAGSIAIDGTSVTGAPPEALARRGLARTFQHGRVFANLTVEDNVLVGAHVRARAARPSASLLAPLAELALALLQPRSVRAEERALRAEARDIVGLFGDRLAPRLAHPAHSLSYANRRRLEIARALAARPKLLLLDEPAAGMNPTETAELAGIIAVLKARGLTILIIEHKLDMLMRLADRIVAMDEGAVIAEGPPDAVRRHPAVIEAFLGRDVAGIRSLAEPMA